MATVYDADTGRILFCTAHTRPEDMQVFSRANNEIVMEGTFFDNEYYVVEHEAVPRPALLSDTMISIKADGVDEFVISDVPAGTVITIKPPGKDWIVDTVDDGEYVFTTMEPNRYGLEVLPPFPYKHQTGEIHAS